MTSRLAVQIHSSVCAASGSSGVQYMNITFFGWQGAKPSSLRKVFTFCTSAPASQIGLLPTNNGTMPRRDRISSDSAVDDEL